MKWPVTIERQAEPEVAALDWANLPFGRVFSRHCALARYDAAQWEAPTIRPMSELALHPGTSALHYGQAIFEGLKAYRRRDGTRLVFRLRDHHERLNRSARRLVMPEVPWELFRELVLALLRLEESLFPPDLSHAVYVRPLLFATDPWLGVRPSDTYLLVIYLTPVGSYYEGPVRAYVETEMSRATPGGTGSIKMAGNYAAALLSGQKAKAHHCQVSLWLDAVERQWVEEYSTMNAFFVFRGPVIVTPSLERGTILPGITRDTLLYLARRRGWAVEERDLAIEEVVQGIAEGRLLEAFGTGTAATVMPIQAFWYEGKLWELPPEAPYAQMLRADYYSLLAGTLPAPPEWITLL